MIFEIRGQRVMLDRDDSGTEVNPCVLPHQHPHGGDKYVVIWSRSFGHFRFRKRGHLLTII